MIVEYAVTFEKSGGHGTVAKLIIYPEVLTTEGQSENVQMVEAVIAAKDAMMDLADSPQDWKLKDAQRTAKPARKEIVAATHGDI